MRKRLINQTVGFTAEIIFFVLTGFFIASHFWLMALWSLIISIVVAGFTSKQIEQDTLEQYHHRMEKKDHIQQKVERRKRK